MKAMTVYGIGLGAKIQAVKADVLVHDEHISDAALVRMINADARNNGTKAEFTRITRRKTERVVEPGDVCRDLWDRAVADGAYVCWTYIWRRTPDWMLEALDHARGHAKVFIQWAHWRLLEKAVDEGRDPAAVVAKAARLLNAYECEYPSSGWTRSQLIHIRTGFRWLDAGGDMYRAVAKALDAVEAAMAAAEGAERKSPLLRFAKKA